MVDHSMQIYGICAICQKKQLKIEEGIKK